MQKVKIFLWLSMALRHFQIHIHQWIAINSCWQKWTILIFLKKCINLFIALSSSNVSKVKIFLPSSVCCSIYKKYIFRYYFINTIYATFPYSSIALSGQIWYCLFWNEMNILVYSYFVWFFQKLYLYIHVYLLHTYAIK